MRRDLAVYRPYQVFLNYPYDPDYRPFAEALAFGVVAAGLLPVSALDLTSPDTARLELLVTAITNCHYSAHDLSRCHGEGPNNYARMNMPVEMGMAIFHAMNTQRTDHRCAFFTPHGHAYQQYASDLAGLDPKTYDEDPETLLKAVYDWLRQVGPRAIVSSQPTVDVVTAFREFGRRCGMLDGADPGGLPSHLETREVMYQVCAERNWWDWRGTKAGADEFPALPLRVRDQPATPLGP